MIFTLIQTVIKSESERLCQMKVHTFIQRGKIAHGILKQHKKSAEISAEFSVDFFAEIPAYLFRKGIKKQYLLQSQNITHK